MDAESECDPFDSSLDDLDEASTLYRDPSAPAKLGFRKPLRSSTPEPVDHLDSSLEDLDEAATLKPRFVPSPIPLTPESSWFDCTLDRTIGKR